MQALELVGEAKSPAPKATALLMEKARDQGLVVGKGGLYGNCIRISPPLNIDQSDVDEAAQRLDKALAEAKLKE
jgi:4-aminobutyrate aminotransferase-like enzyme